MTDTSEQHFALLAAIERVNEARDRLEEAAGWISDLDGHQADLRHLYATLDQLAALRDDLKNALQRGARRFAGRVALREATLVVEDSGAAYVEIKDDDDYRVPVRTNPDDGAGPLFMTLTVIDDSYGRAGEILVQLAPSSSGVYQIFRTHDRRAARALQETLGLRLYHAGRLVDLSKQED